MDIRDMIRERGLLQKWVARQVGIDYTAFSRMVNGERQFPPAKVSAIAKVLRYPVHEVRAAIDAVRESQ